METPETHFWRGFWIALFLLVGLPLVLVFLALTGPFAVLYAYGIAPILVYAFPVALFLPDAGVGGLILSLMMMIALSVAMGMITRRRGAGSQLLWTLGMYVLWAGLWWLVALLVGVQPHFNTRM